MKFLLDTHLLLWAASGSTKLSKQALKKIDDEANTVFFSAASIWEVAIKQALGWKDFRVDASILRRALLDNGYLEIPIASEHAAAVTTLPQIHKDPFDRILVAQAQVEGVTLLTSDAIVATYTGPIEAV